MSKRVLALAVLFTVATLVLWGILELAGEVSLHLARGGY